jgi:hypothetical protein
MARQRLRAFHRKRREGLVRPVDLAATKPPFAGGISILNEVQVVDDLDAKVQVSSVLSGFYSRSAL